MLCGGFPSLSSKVMKNELYHIIGTLQFLWAISQSYIIYPELENPKMCLDTDTDMNETLNTVTGYNFNADTDLEYEKKI